MLKSLTRGAGCGIINIKERVVVMVNGNVIWQGFGGCIILTFIL